MLLLSLKISGMRKANNKHVIIVNYIIAAIASIVISTMNKSITVFTQLPSVDFSSLLTAKNLAGTALIVLIMGMICGFAFPLNLFEMNTSIPINGSAITSFFKQMSTVGGLLVAIVLMGERPSTVQWIGMLLMIGAIVLMVCDFKSLKIENGLILLLIFLTGTVMETGNKVISKYCLVGYSNLYLGVLFTVALIYTIIRVKNEDGSAFGGFTWKDVFYGAILGLSNLGNNFFKIQALSVLPAAVVIPCVAAGALILTNLVCIVFFKEKANKTYFIAIGLAVISMFLLNR